MAPRAERLTDTVTLYEGDCLAVLPTLEPGSVDAVITDPPYGIDLQGSSSGGRHGRRRAAKEYTVDGDHDTTIGQSVVDWMAAKSLPSVVFASPRKPWQGKWDSLLVWDKGGAVGGGGDVRRCWKPTWELVQVARVGELREGRDAAVLKYTALPSLSSVHPAAKPVGLMRYLVRQTTDPGSTILDPFAGSGTTGIAAMLEGRRCILIEKDPAYCEVIRRRVRECDQTAPGTLFADPSLFSSLAEADA